MRYEYIKEGDRWIDHADPITKAKEAEYFEKQRKEKERRIRISAKIKTLVVTNKEDIDIDIDLLTNQKFDFQCYTIGCPFTTNNKLDYECHVVTKHYGKGLCYPGKIDIKTRGWTAQGRKWEI